jgi:hypothetical protein
VAAEIASGAPSAMATHVHIGAEIYASYDSLPCGEAGLNMLN